ncbi:dolichyl pyrophosphate Man9GlcNAc2 alpha-1,3-glucosyltransferase [Diutina catenulata]
MANKSKKKGSAARQVEQKAEKLKPFTQEGQRTSYLEQSPAHDLLQYFKKSPDQWTARYVVVMTALVIRGAVGLGGWSGRGVSPMFGDFEAQRHWLEITNHLPINQWYWYDLQYWGLDYPPLTAFHSWILGKIGTFLNPEWFALDTSRGLETDAVKNYMRYSALVSELLLYIPSVLLLVNLIAKRFRLSRMDQIVTALVIIGQPGLILIDHGHFQYNSVMLGFFLWSVIELIRGRLVLASIWFICCINFKQMGLYYSTFIFVYILSQLKSFQQLVQVGVTVLVTQAVLLLPFIIAEAAPGGASSILESLTQILIRVFPFNRGLFEDKVANFWCVSNVVVKYKNILEAAQLSKLALLATIAAIIPINVILFYKLRKATKNEESTRVRSIILGFTGNALAFYLFSYQVHEKSILIPLLPATFLLCVDPNMIDIVQWINNVGCFSMYPLLKRDELGLQYFVTVFLINWLVGARLGVMKSRGWMWDLVIKGSYAAMIIFHIADKWFSPPTQWPDLWVILNCTISFGCFAFFYLWINYQAYIMPY